MGISFIWEPVCMVCGAVWPHWSYWYTYRRQYTRSADSAGRWQCSPPPADYFHPDLSSPARASTGWKQRPTGRLLPYRCGNNGHQELLGEKRYRPQSLLPLSVRSSIRKKRNSPKIYLEQASAAGQSVLSMHFFS